ncbi:MAG: helix-turn-helix domain-containing protein [Gemmatimonadetes bacterium]|uniref:Helix-turn-helix domain-containing protein n=1 Tax=Candidatus Kutchimonas denitrificans TaxID=3056748 RepID=A0AAE4Z5K2_9BACT|nr:helix-turn-helix domain-containing protein [Gemmatimonadota bacterium]NIR74210.1 helix-turn-helix domain-containing protein [Candidatus Kutchimonas denitrificans]NIR99832.1 helix-turn-helix domain-containing protein [Gemmatimonadota bacterium]NIT65421.1 helix-turn-helix domain-containing protein [Gemmatimonadota bacterium]NIU51786.1 helix-turn-helix domain-containing protein [Gemmatimonadota bacterium]
MREALEDAYDLTIAADWSELDHLIRREATEVIIVDPVRPDVVEVPAIERLRAYYPSLPVVLYMPFGPSLADALLRLGSIGVHRAVFFDHGDTEKALRQAVDEAVESSVPETILARILDGLAIDSAGVEGAFRLALGNVDTVRSALDWSSFLDLPHRTFYRTFREFGLPSPKTCLLWLRLMYAARLLEDPGYNPYDVVHRLGYSAPSNFWRHVQDTLGLRASELRYAATFETLLRRFLSDQLRARTGTEDSS